MKKIIYIIIVYILLIQESFCLGQKTVPIYEFGDSIIEYETNFKNLSNNWIIKNITNADDYILEDFSFVETISDSIIFNHYRNYFSSIHPLRNKMSIKSGGNSWGAHYRNTYIEPHYIYKELFSQDQPSPIPNELFSEDFKSEGIDILTRYINIDSLDLKFYYAETNESVSEYKNDNKGKLYKKSESEFKSQRRVALPDSISINFKEIYLDQVKSIEDLTIPEKRSYLLEELLNHRILTQLDFNDRIGIGDRVYKIKFSYKSNPYNCYVICNALTKKVTWDYFFKDIMVDSNNFLE
ncbi:hypothetical protein [Carboxylicivirga caseinilyticus]|uniref:hypothetical protein n=1 Tax=Carboxylicivirga caseinilyticus TaxID=3417572 RepID=UPI003D32662F|nr:hypothetical protein [Marinilabiliaceae bacterium A049]